MQGVYGLVNGGLGGGLSVTSCEAVVMPHYGQGAPRNTLT